MKTTKTFIALSLAFLISFLLKAEEQVSAQVSPCEDFDTYMNAKWKAENPVPPTESRWGVFNILNKDNEKKVNQIIDELSEKTYPKNTYQQQISDLYKSMMDVKTRNKLGISPLKPFFKSIDNAISFNNLIILNNLIPGTSLPIEGGVEADLMNSKLNTFYLSQSGLMLGDRDYYLSNDEDKTHIRNEYEKYISRVERILGNSKKKSDKIAHKILEIEIATAKLHLPKEEMRNPFKIYNKFSLDQLKELSSAVHWTQYFNSINIQANEVIVTNPEMLKEYQTLINSFSLKDWKDYMKFHLVANKSQYLTEELEKEGFNFFSTVMSGVKEQKPMDERVISRINGLLGESVGRVYADKYFPKESKEKVEHMIENMRSAFKDRIEGLTWMSDSTKQEALQKLSTFTYKIGYPNKWTDYTSIDIQADKLFENVMKINHFEIQKNLSKYGKEVDKEEWMMNPQTVNAYYNPLQNEIVFPAGILQAPFYNPQADDAVNYGGIGAVIGHEFSHGFDDQGSKFDADGNLRDWWKPQDREKFNALTEQLADEYSKFEILPGIFVNGKFTLGENIADQGGIILSYNALMKEYKNKPEPPLVNGLNFKQRFFYGWAKVWRNNSTDEILKQLITVDPHSPAKARINVTLSNIDEFFKAFSCEPNKNAVVIW
ncbi:MAG: M13 family metallopeptidase [Chitinophagales bacterium]|nr:M13 family metallopeptidase [Chitinophagales bacterium]